MRSRLADNSRYVLGSTIAFEEMLQIYAQIFREAHFTIK